MGQEFVKPGNAPQWLGELVFKAAAKVFSNSTQVSVVRVCEGGREAAAAAAAAPAAAAVTVSIAKKPQGA
jgi:hypothetical protein